MTSKKIWQGRFSKQTASALEKFSHSVDLDQRLYHEDLLVNRAWTQALHGAGVLEKQEKDRIGTALQTVEEEFAQGNFAFHPQDEDIHSAIERRVTELAGEAGAKLHTGRSRNDQVMTDLLLYLKRTIADAVTAVEELQKAAVDLAEQNGNLIMPGYTHLQQAQPILFSHYLLSLFWLLERDKKRLAEARKHCSLMPLGAGALAGSGFPVDRTLLAELLHFEEPSRNSLDITAHRDLPTEAAFALANLSLHLSRYAADLTIWSSREFGFVTLDESYATGSSIMPQKRNPDSLELIRGKAASAIGHLTALMTVCHGLPHGYNRDLQQDKEHLFAIIDIAAGSLEVFTGVLRTLQVNRDAIAAALNPELLATELADYLVERGMSFRKAHETTGELVTWAQEHGLPLDQIPLEDMKRFSPLFDEQAGEWLDFAGAISRRNLPGGTGPESVANQLESAKQLLKRSQP